MSRDLAPPAWRRLAMVRSRLETFLGRRGYESVGVPTLEQTDLFLRKSGGELAARMYSFTDPAGRRMSLRPEFTSSVVRAYIDGAFQGPLPLRLQYRGTIFRYETEDTTSSNETGPTAVEFEQFGAEIIGVAGEAADAEVIALAAQGLALLGVRGHRVRIGHVGVANALLSALGLSERARVFVLGALGDLRSGGAGADAVRMRAEEIGLLSTRRGRRLTSLASRLEAEDAREMVEGFLSEAVTGPTGQRSPEEIFQRYLGKLREVEAPAALDRALKFGEELATTTGPVAQARKKMAALAAKYDIDAAVLDPLDQLISALAPYDLMGVPVTLDLGMTRGIAYYTGAVFAIEHAKIKGAPSLGGGGRYDGLVKALGGTQDAPALGFAYNLEILAQLLPQAFGAEESDTASRVLVTPQEAGMDQAVATAERLRAQGIHVEVEMLGRSDAQVAKYAQQRGIETVIRVGSDGTVDETRV